MCLLFLNPICLLISRKCVFLSLPHPGSLYSQTPPLLFPHVQAVCGSLLFSISHGHSCLPLLSRLYVSSFSFINIDVSLFWMKPQLQIWDHGLFDAWKHHQSKLLHVNNDQIHAESNDKWRFLLSFTHVNILTISCLLKIEGCTPNGHRIVWGVEWGDLIPHTIYIFPGKHIHIILACNEEEGKYCM